MSFGLSCDDVIEVDILTVDVELEDNEDNEDEDAEEDIVAFARVGSASINIVATRYGRLFEM